MDVESELATAAASRHAVTSAAGDATASRNASATPTLPTISIAKGGGAIRGIGEKFAVNPATGTAGLTVPLPLSSGRSGFGPQLSLSYDSGNGNGIFGFGWSLSLAAITRKTARGLPRYLDAEDSDTFILAGAEDLVPVPTRPGRYRPRIEGGFSRIERLVDDNGETYWRTISRENVTTLYGTDTQSRITSSDKVFSWLVSASYDDRGNAIVFEYADEDDAGVDLGLASEQRRDRTTNRYLTHIRYGNRMSRLVDPTLSDPDWMFDVVFDYDEGYVEPIAPDHTRPAEEQHRRVFASAQAAYDWSARPDPFSYYQPGFEVRTHRRCHRVLMFHSFPELGATPTLIRSVGIDYADLSDPRGDTEPRRPDDALVHDGSTRFGSFIKAITLAGYQADGAADGRASYIVKTMPPLELVYSKAEISDDVLHLEPNSADNLPAGVDGRATQFVDLDGEGMPGILSRYETAWLYKRNLGSATFDDLQTLPGAPNSGTRGDIELIDLDGNGQLDAVAMSGPTPGFYRRTLEGEWSGQEQFRALPVIDWDDANLRFVDLNGDGHADAMLTEADGIRWHPSLADEGFASAVLVGQPRDESVGPRLVFADEDRSVYLADMSGDGLVDLVQIRQHDVRYWPNRGYGSFGPLVQMDNAPGFDREGIFSQSRIRLADIDGSGTTDIIYLTGDGAELYFNQSGNRLTDARPLRIRQPDQFSSVDVVDMLGRGTSCLVWSSPLPAGGGSPLAYVDLMRGGKPHLLISTANNLGGETHVSYAPSTRFYQADRDSGRRWITRIPFPVHVVDRMSTIDRISRSTFVARYAYHHGYFDGFEREFRGFGMVEQWDTELHGDLALADEQPAETATDVPATLTRRWYHTGAYQLRGRISDYFAGQLDSDDVGEYYREPGLSDAQARAMLLDDTVLPGGLTEAEEREACRALKGALLREETYASDGVDPAGAPYAIKEQNFTIEVVQRMGDNVHAVFFTHPRESLMYHYERSPDDPRTTHELTLDVDDYGNILRAASIGYPRRTVDSSLPQALQTVQATAIVTATVTRLTNPVDSGDAFRGPQPAESRAFELTGLKRLGGARYSFSEIEDALSAADDLEYDAIPSRGFLQRRLVSAVRMLYRSNDLTRALPLGQVEFRAVPFETYQRALTAGLVDAYGGRVDATTLAAAGYVRLTGDTGWWAPSGRVFFSPDPTDTPEQELAAARAGFYLPRRQRSALDAEEMPVDALVEYDVHHLLTRETTDALGNKVTAGERDIDPSQPAAVAGLDYRVLQPALMMDPNRNRTALAFDALGLVAAIAVMGKPEDVPAVGDLLGSDLEPNPTQAQVVGAIQDPRGTVAAALLGDATTRVVYDVDAYERSKDSDDPRPAVALSISRESHVSQGKPPGGVRRQIRLVYSDGGGAEIQRKAQVGDGPVPVRDAAGSVVLDDDGQPTMTKSDVPRWACSAWSIRNNKGLVVRPFEPFFTDTPRYEFDLRIGTGPILMYDPLGRLIATVRADQAWQKTVFDQWRQVIWDVNDTLLISDPARDADVGASISKLPPADYLPTWYGLRADPASAAARARRWPEASARAAEQAAAQQAAIHAATPTTVHTDALGRAVLTVSHNRFRYGDDPAGSPPTERFESTRLVLDTEGRQREVIDARDRVVRRCVYDMLGRRLVEVTIDAGTRWSLTDVIGQPIASWDSSGAAFRNEYDALRRPLRTFVSSPGQPESLVGRSVYGEQHPAPEASNLRSHAFLRFDPAGVTGSEAYDFKGNLLTSSRRMTVDYRGDLGWSQVDAVIPSSSSILDPVMLAATVDTLLDSDTFTARTEFDALNRPTIGVTPDASVTRLQYDLGGHLNSVEVNLLGETSAGQPVWTPFVTSIRYNAFGQREQCTRHDSTGATPDLTTTYSYEPRTHRLLGVITASGARSVQDLRYFYDPSGNVTRRDDGAQQTLFFRNKRVEPLSDFSYDACYRLVEATGRELLPTGSRLPPSWDDASAISPSQPGDGNTLGRYVERYHYDPVGNITQMLHRGPDPTQAGWTRTFQYSEPSKLDVTVFGNRLTSSTVAAAQPVVEAMAYDERGNLTQLPHLVASAAGSMQWDALGRLRKVSLGGGGTVFYQYDAAGQRVRKIWEKPGGLVEERLYLGPFERFTKRLHGQPQLVRDTLHVADGERRVAIVENRRLDVAGNDPAPERLARYQLTDRLGSVVLELDAAGQILSYEEYTPYGSTSYSSAVAPLPKRYHYIGKERDGETGLYYFGSRYYPPWLGRWISCDPAGAEGSINSYGYAAGNPVTLVDPDGAAPLPGEAAALFSKGAQMLSGEGFHLDQGSNQSLLLEAQAGGMVRENIGKERGGFRRAGKYYQHMQGAQENVEGARRLSRKIDSYVGKAQIGEETTANLKGLSQRLWQAAATTDDTIAAAELLADPKSGWSKRFEGMTFKTRQLITEQLPQMVAEHGAPATLLPDAAVFEGVLEGIGNLAVRGRAPVGINFYSGLGFIQKFFESAAWEKIASKASSVASEAAERGAAASEWIAAKGVTAGAWLATKGSAAIEVGSKFAGYLLVFLAIKGGDNATKSLLSVEKNQRLNVYYTSKDAPPTGQQLLFQLAVTGVGLADALSVDVRAGVGDWDWGKEVGETFMDIGMSPAQRDFTEWMRVELGLVPGGQR